MGERLRLGARKEDVSIMGYEASVQDEGPGFFFGGSVGGSCPAAARFSVHLPRSPSLSLRLTKRSATRCCWVNTGGVWAIFAWGGRKEWPYSESGTTSVPPFQLAPRSPPNGAPSPPPNPRCGRGDHSAKFLKRDKPQYNATLGTNGTRTDLAHLPPIGLPRIRHFVRTDSTARHCGKISAYPLAAPDFPPRRFIEIPLNLPEPQRSQRNRDNPEEALPHLNNINVMELLNFGKKGKVRVEVSTGLM
ncbi:hypothetical protein KM043_016040 [Ampulex compressa]|nr:hypothetical protein KM043_016040 [Ampulex compressa]